MVSPSSGDDYYASLGNDAAQTSRTTEKKKIIKIVAKKAAVPTAETPVKSGEPKESPLHTEPVQTVETPAPSEPVETAPEAQPYISRTVKLPESGTLDLGGKFSTGPAVVFHTHSTLPKPLGSNKMRSNAPLAR